MLAPINLGSLFHFIPQRVNVPIRGCPSPQHCHTPPSPRLRQHHHQSLDEETSKTENPLSQIVKNKNKKMAEEKKRSIKEEMNLTKFKMRTSEVSKRITRTSGFFGEKTNKPGETSYEKETDRIDKKHGLLRAIIKTKYEDSKFNQPDFYN